jgi:hypothetical protein
MSWGDEGGGHMELPLLGLSTGWVIGIALFLLLLIPYLIWEIRRGKGRGHTWFTWWKPRGHSDIGPDTGGVPYTKPGMDEAGGARR